MSAVRYVVLAALVVWLGGMVVLGLLVAPSVFRVLEGVDPEGGRVIAGAVFGEVLRRFHLLAYVCGTTVLVGLFLMKFVGPPPAAFAVRVALTSGMLAVALYSGFPVSREIAQLQSDVQGPMHQLPARDPRRLRFDALHETSTTLMTTSVVLGLVSLFWYTRE